MSLDAAKLVLKKYWNYPDFRGRQADVIQAILSGNDLLALLATGAGKSICYQVPSMLHDGITLVISPLVALMVDQVEQLISRGIPAIALHSGMQRNEIDRELDNAIYGSTKLLYVSPERLHTEIFKARVSKMNVKLVAIDEAHCISQWGHDFRPAYTQLDCLKEYFPNAPICAFTATATKQTRKDIVEQLALHNPTVIQETFAKPNLIYINLSSMDKWNEFLLLIQRLEGHGLVYVNNRKQCERYATQLKAMGYAAEYYHAGLSYKQRSEIQQDWYAGKYPIIFCTNAFGMGIDKSDLRWVIHLDVPSSIEAYYQEAGRAGRDGETAFSIVLFNPSDIRNAVKQFEIKRLNYTIVNQIYEQICSFLNIPLGSGQGEQYDFDLDLFCQKYKLPRAQVLEVLKLFEEHELISLSESMFQSSSLLLGASFHQYFNAQARKTDFSEFLTILIRSYDGLFTQFVKISEERLARNTSIDLKQVIKYLRAIEDLGLGTYNARSEALQCTFLAPRTEAKSLPIDYKKVDERYYSNYKKLEAVCSYVESETCRESSILQYFGETARQDCGHCDVCKGSQKDDFTTQDLEACLSFLKKQNRRDIPVFECLHWWPMNKRKKILGMLSVLDQEERIRISNNVIQVI